MRDSDFLFSSFLMVTFFVGDGIHTALAFTSSGRELAITVAGHEQVLEAFAILGMDGKMLSCPPTILPS